MRAAAPHLDHLFDDLRLLPTVPVRKLRGVLRVRFFNKQVLRVDETVGRAPGDHMVVAHHERRLPRIRGAADLQPRAAQVHLVDRTRQLHIQMGVRTQQGAPVEAVLGRHHPAVGPLPLAAAQPGAGTLVLGQQQPGRGQQPLFCLAAHSLEQQWILVGVIRLQVRCRIRVQIVQETQPRQLALPVDTHRPRRGLGACQGIERRPWLHLRPQQVDLRGQPPLVGRHIGVDARRIPLQHLACLRVQRCQFRLGRTAKAHDAAKAVGVQRRRTEQLGQPPGGNAPGLLHLPHAVLGMQPALRTPEVGLALGIDVRHAVLVAQDLHRLFETCHMQLAFQLWHRPLQPPPVDVQKQRGGQERKQEKDGDEYNRKSAEHGIFHRCVLCLSVRTIHDGSF